MLEQVGRLVIDFFDSLRNEVDIYFTEQEKSVLISSDEEEVASAKIKRERQLLSMD
jgi:hypothetical protein